MNRRRLLIGLAVVVPLALFGAAKWASWRPIELARFDTTNWSTISVEANQNFVAVGDAKVDLRTGAKSPMTGQLLGVGTWTWQRVTSPKIKGYLSLEDGVGHERKYALPGIGGEWDYSPVGPIVRYTPKADRLEMISNGIYYRWKWQSQQLERTVKVKDMSEMAITRDGESIIYPGVTDIVTLSTRTGRPVARANLGGLEFFETNRISPFGSYALYEAPDHYFTQHVVNTRTGRTLWNLKMDNNNRDAVFSPDETLIAVPQAKNKVWEIRELPNGHLLRTLPLVPGLDDAAFSPDNSTFYSVANDVLYQQRAR